MTVTYYLQYFKDIQKAKQNKYILQSNFNFMFNSIRSFAIKIFLVLLVSMDSGSLLMSEIVDIPDDSSPSEDSCLLEVGLRNQGERGNRMVGEGGDGGDSVEYISFRGPPSQTPESPLAGGPRARRFLRGERSNSCSSPSTATTTYR